MVLYIAKGCDEVKLDYVVYNFKIFKPRIENGAYASRVEKVRFYGSGDWDFWKLGVEDLSIGVNFTRNLRTFYVFILFLILASHSRA